MVWSLKYFFKGSSTIEVLTRACLLPVIFSTWLGWTLNLIPKEAQNKNSETFENLALMCHELCTPPSHTYGNEYRFLVRHNLLRLVPEKGFCIEPLLLSRGHLKVHKK